METPRADKQYQGPIMSLQRGPATPLNSSYYARTQSAYRCGMELKRYVRTVHTPAIGTHTKHSFSCIAATTSCFLIGCCSQQACLVCVHTAGVCTVQQKTSGCGMHMCAHNALTPCRSGMQTGYEHSTRDFTGVAGPLCGDIMGPW